MQLSDLLEYVLNEVENRINEDINADLLADRLGFSSIHLQRLFKLTFNQSLGAYIRSRKLTASLENLYNTSSRLIDIALEYDFEYEETYIKAFKREFGVTPGVARKTRQILKVTPPFDLMGAKLFENEIMFKPEIVMVPQFHVIGMKHHLHKIDAISMAPKLAIHFWENERSSIPNTIDRTVYLGLTIRDSIDADYTCYMPSIQVETLKNIPEGFDSYTFNPSLYVRFRYIGQHHYYELDQNRAKSMYSDIEKYFGCEYRKITGIFFEKIDTKSFDGFYCQMEWLGPIRKL